MDEMIKEVDAIYRMISTIAVSGDAVDAVAAVRAKLRKLYAAMEHMTPQEPVKEVSED